MNRRQFFKRVATAAVVTAVAPEVLSELGKATTPVEIPTCWADAFTPYYSNLRLEQLMLSLTKATEYVWENRQREAYYELICSDEVAKDIGRMPAGTD